MEAVTYCTQSLPRQTTRMVANREDIATHFKDRDRGFVSDISIGIRLLGRVIEREKALVKR